MSCLVAALRRSSEKNKKANNMNDYYMVIGGFCAVMAGAGVYTVLNPQQSFATTPIIDEASILVHNGQSHRFQQSANDFFGVSLQAEADTYRTGRSLTLSSSLSRGFRTRSRLSPVARARTKIWRFQSPTTGVSSTQTVFAKLLLRSIRSAPPATCTLR